MTTICITENALKTYVNTVLFYLWDPIRINCACARGLAPVVPAAAVEGDSAVPEADDAPVSIEAGMNEDEYSSYVPEFVAMILEGASLHQMYENLRDIELNSLYGCGDQEITRDVAHRLHAIGQGISRLSHAG